MNYRRPPVSEETANKIWGVLVEHCGASDNPDASLGRRSFVPAAVEGRWTEFRFMGAIGGGGKVWNNSGFYVNCYPEEQNEANLARMKAANEKLAKLYSETYGIEPHNTPYVG